MNEIKTESLLALTSLCEIRLSEGDVYKWARDPETNHRLEIEAETLLRLEGEVSGPAVYDTDVVRGRRFIRMEFIQGKRLDEISPMKPADHWTMAYMLSTSIKEMHDMGYVHCDIKPTNLIKTEDEIRLIDFGSAFEISTPPKKTRCFSFITAGFAPPEVHAGKQWTQAGDIFSLGATLYYLVSGKSPFSASMAESIASNVCFNDPKELDASIWPVIRNCLQKHVDNRYEEINQIWSDLDRIRDGKDIVDRTPAPITVVQFMTLKKRELTVEAVIAACCVFTLISLGMMAWAYFASGSRPADGGRSSRPHASSAVMTPTSISFEHTAKAKHATTIRNASHEYTFAPGDRQSVMPGYYIAEFRPVKGGDSYFEPLHVPNTLELKTKKWRSRRFSTGSKFRASNGAFQLIISGRTKDTAVGSALVASPLPVDGGPFIQGRRSGYQLANDCCRNRAVRLPTYSELIATGRNGSDFHYFEAMQRGTKKQTFFVPRNGKLLVRANYNMLPKD